VRDNNYLIINKLKDLGLEISFEERTDFIGFKVKPLVIAYPQGEDDVINIVRLAREFRISIVPWGAGTSLTGAVSCDGCILLDMRRMNKILEINTIDWYVRVQPGVVLDDLNRELSKYGFFFPPDPASHYMCTVGGIIATDAGGMRALKYGTVKDWVLALRVVLPIGEVIKVGEPLKKNRAGYDLVHLFVGSEGTLGIITEAWLKIIPLPKRKVQTLIVYLDDMETLAKFVYEVRRRGIMPELMEYMDPYAINAVNQAFNAGLKVADGGLVIIMIEEDLMDELLNIRINGLNIVIINEEEARRIYELRSRAGEAIKAVYGSFYSEDITVPISRLTEAIIRLKELGDKYRKPMPILAHIGDGNMHPHILYKPGEEELAQRMYYEVARIAIELGGTISGEHGIGLQKRELLYEQYLVRNNIKTLEVMKNIKRLFDPNDIMNPNKYIY
jgi:glycolate oxidase subunit GlcD